jgi:iron(III) transport system substrate-binding protein
MPAANMLIWAIRQQKPAQNYSKRDMKTNLLITLLAIISLFTTLLPGCTPSNARQVVIYTSVDQVFSEPVLQQFEQQTGIRVLPVYDVEAAKTTGLVNRLITEKSHPRADVFWNGEFAQTILLQQQGVLAPYLSPNAADIPAKYVDPEGYWTGIGGRARVLLVNTRLVSPDKYPKSIFDLAKNDWPADKIGIANPAFGSTGTEAAALYAVLGQDQAKAFYTTLYNRGVRVLAGIAEVRQLVSSGQLMMGLVDTDDAIGAINDGSPVTMVFLDQNGMGTLVLPNTVALIAGGPHPAEGKMLLDFLLSHNVTESLVKAGWSQVPIRASDPISPAIKNVELNSMNVSLTEIYGQLKTSQNDLAQIFIK